MPATDDVTAPEKLTAEQDVSAFKSGEPTLDDWLKRRALADEESGASRTYMNSGGPCERHPERFVGLGRQRHAQHGSLRHDACLGRFGRRRAHRGLWPGSVVRDDCRLRSVGPDQYR